jgi:thiol-disulfide isomerase/thioredoxin
MKPHKPHWLCKPNLFALYFILAALNVSVWAQLPAQPSLDQIKAENFVVQTLAGKKVQLNKLLGEGKPLVLDIWATWCGPCRQEIPHLVELAEKYRQDGLIVIGLTTEDPTVYRSRVKDFVKQYGMTYTVGFASEALYLSFNNGSPSMRIPQTFIFGADGKLIKRLIGYSERIGAEVLNKSVQEALKVLKPESN